MSDDEKEVKKTNSVCPYCGVGCLLTFNTSNNKIFSDEVDTVTQVNRIKIVEEFFTTIGLAFNCLGIEAAESM